MACLLSVHGNLRSLYKEAGARIRSCGGRLYFSMLVMADLRWVAG